MGGGKGGLLVPPALVRMAGMEPGPLTVESEVGGEWQSSLVRSSLQDSKIWIYTSWSAVVAALRLEAGQSICLAARSPSRLLISR